MLLMGRTKLIEKKKTKPRIKYFSYVNLRGHPRIGSWTKLEESFKKMKEEDVYRRKPFLSGSIPLNYNPRISICLSKFRTVPD